MKFLCGYNMNLDAVYSITGEDIAELLELVDGDVLFDSFQRSSGAITSISDLIAGLVGCMQDGTGAEWFIQEVSVFRFLMDHFYDRAVIRVGGNMAIMANVMSEMGAEEVVVNPVGDVGSIRPLISGKNVIFPEERDNNLKSSLKGAKEKIVHFVFDFKEGLSFELFGKNITVPRENRFIATYDNVNTELYISPAFEDYSLEYVKVANGAIVSGFNQLRSSYPDSSGPVEKFEKALFLIKEWKELNSDLLVHAELGHFSTYEMAVFIFTELSGIVDSIGMNEDEIAMLFEIHGIPKERFQEINSIVIVEACVKCIHATGLKKMVVHTRDFIISVFRDTVSSCNHEMQSLEFGIMCAAFFAATGKLPYRPDIESSVTKFSRSEYGL
ncbi:ADP-dependent glucokinase [Methanococcoides burtonii DSM 6242]|uniref:ADP-dependent glucokinase n=1 Tax=Methanococcoides burtonii (strain DSM 6242 / NBRC 107633 / OCM 468 / ACE-M) TaxID=259564 RepID=Q12WC0_METBU|nr:ADP-dependent glucokinase [Methanococcoides burtonii DSM 6242]